MSIRMKARGKGGKPSITWGRKASKKLHTSEFKPTNNSNKNYTKHVLISLLLFVSIILGFILFKK